MLLTSKHRELMASLRGTLDKGQGFTPREAKVVTEDLLHAMARADEGYRQASEVGDSVGRGFWAGYVTALEFLAELVVTEVGQ